MNGPGATAYTSSFYDEQKDGSLDSAREVLPHVVSLVQPRSVLDAGCGVGTWLEAFREQGVGDVLGVDGEYVDRSQLLIPQDRFVSADLTRALDLGRQFDLVMSVEVAEHLPSSAAETFVESLTRHGKVVLFSAAIPGQGGTRHVNERWPEYWRRLFEPRGYVPVDCLRDRFWDNAKISPCYRQNLLLYVERTALLGHPRLLEEQLRPKSFPMNLVHPAQFTEVLGRTTPLRKLLHDMPRAVSLTLRVRAGQLASAVGRARR